MMKGVRMVRRRAGRLSLWVAIVIAIASPFALQSCGGDEPSEEDRTLEMCDACNPRVEGDCLRECLRFCLPNEDCETRCEAQCDFCRRDLRCQACSGSCDGGEPLRCAPLDEIIDCDDGSFGGGGANVPTNVPTPTMTPAATPGGATPTPSVTDPFAPTPTITPTSTAATPTPSVTTDPLTPTPTATP
jgi:hypothetical protein